MKTLLAAYRRAGSRQGSLLAAGVAFYAFMSLFPAIIAGVLTYGLVASPATVAKHSKELSDALPNDAASVVTGQLKSLTESSSGSLGIGLVVAIVLALWSASGGVGNLVTAVNQMFGFPETRNAVKRKLLALGLTLGAIVFVIVTITLVAVVPALLDHVVDGTAARVGIDVVRWAGLVAALLLALAVLFRVAPARPEPPTHWITRGVVAASVLWLVASVAFSVYVDHFGSYAKTYGALAGVVVLLLWLWVGIYAILLGASLEATDEDVPTAEGTSAVSGDPPSAGAAHRAHAPQDQPA